VTILIINAIAILSEDRFLARVGWSRATISAADTFGSPNQQDVTMKGKVVELIQGVRTIMRGKGCSFPLISLDQNKKRGRKIKGFHAG